MSKTPTREAKTQAIIPISRGQIVKAGELAETDGAAVTGEIDGRVPPALTDPRSREYHPLQK